MPIILGLAQDVGEDEGRLGPMGPEHDNLRSALQWFIDHERLNPSYAKLHRSLVLGGQWLPARRVALVECGPSP